MLEPGPGVEFGRYVVVGRPANYGAGSLVPARETRSGARRTLWLVMPQAVADPGHRAAVCRVATVLRKLESPHLLRLHEFGEVEGQPFFATAPLDGVDLAQVCAPDGIPPEEALDLIVQVGAGINHLHHAGLVEGALGPHRVLVEERDGRIHATVVHAAILPALLSTSALFGSQKQEALDFGAPELHRGEEPTTRSDVYSLGCLLWLALTGERPVASHAGHRSAPTPQVQSDGPVAEALNSVLQRALAKDPAHRYRDVAAFAATIRAIAALAREGDVGELPERLVPAREAATPPVASPVASPLPTGAPPVPAGARETSYAGQHAEPAREPALAAAVEHWAAGLPVTRVREQRKRTGRVLRTGTVAAGLGVLAVASVWGARHLDLLDRLQPDPVTSEGPTVIPASSSAATETRDPLERLFPLAAAGACELDPLPAAHRLERWTCQRTGFRVVLTRWDSQASARALVPHGGEAGAREPWRLDGVRAGTQWTWRAPGGARPFRWTAVYSDVPYAVVIEAKDKPRRRFAREHVVIHPSTVLG